MTGSAPSTSIQLATHLLNRFENAPREQQHAVSQYLEQLLPDLEEPEDFEAVEPVAGAFAGAVGQREWWANTEECETQVHLYRAAAVLRRVPTLAEPVQATLIADAQRVFDLPIAPDPEVIGYLRRIGLELAPETLTTLDSRLAQFDWSDPDLAAALLRVRIEFAQRAIRADVDFRAIRTQDIGQGWRNQKLDDAAHALIAWFQLSPAPDTVRRVISQGPLTDREVENALRDWAGEKTEQQRTSLALALLDLPARAPRKMRAVASRSVDEDLIAARAVKRIRKDLGKATMDERKAVAETVAGIEFVDDKARQRIVDLMTWLLHGRRKKNDQKVFIVLLGCLAPAPLEDTAALERAIERARKNSGLKLTGEQGEKLVALGVQLKEEWFKPKIAKALGRAIERVFG